MIRLTKLCFFICIVFTQFTKAKAQNNTSKIDEAKKMLLGATSDVQKVQSYFFIADSYMDLELYDSAQIWLNKIHQILPVKNNSLNNYFLLTRQAEVYYYNNLQQLGLQESYRGLAMAKILQDSFLLADSYNFLGLFYMNIDSAAQSIPFYVAGLRYTKQPPYPKNYLSLSKPHHLHGNLAEAYFKLKQYDSALYHYQLSLQKATQINWSRGIAVANTGLGDVFYAQKNLDSALLFYMNGNKIALQSNDIDVALICYGGIAKCQQQLNNTKAVDQYLNAGFALLKKHPNINIFYSLLFLNIALDIYHGQNNVQALVNTLEIKSAIETANIKGSNSQLQTILDASVVNEKRLLSLEVEDARQKQNLANTRLMMALIGIALLLIIFFVYRYYQNQRLAIAKIRQKISQDLHDDIGASLSSLQIYSTVAEKSMPHQLDKVKEMLDKISIQSKTIMEDMNDIVWSMNPAQSSSTTISVVIKNYAVALLSDNNILFDCKIEEAAELMLKNITAKRNLLLIAKEAMNNIAKYSKATKVQISMRINHQQLVLQIIDNGIGFDKEQVKMGNGLLNMEKRVTELNGTIQIVALQSKGTEITVHVPLKNI